MMMRIERQCQKLFDEDKDLIFEFKTSLLLILLLFNYAVTSHLNSFHLYRLMTPDDTIS